MTHQAAVAAIANNVALKSLAARVKSPPPSSREFIGSST